MIDARLLTLLSVVAVASCTSAPKTAPTDPATETLQRSASTAYSEGRYEQATTMYQAALQSALARDNSADIVDARFSLALSQTASGLYQRALLQLDRAEAELQRAKLQPDNQLTLLRATVLFRAGDAKRAYKEVEYLLSRRELQSGTTARAHFLAGLAAAAMEDTKMLRRHAQLLGTQKNAAAADRLELLAHINALTDKADRAVEQFSNSVNMRRQSGDYRGMVRALASTAATLRKAGMANEAAAYYLRAGRSAALPPDKSSPKMKSPIAAILCVILLAACSGKSIEQRKAAQAVASEQITAQIPAVAETFKKACIPYLEDASYDEIKSLLEVDGFEGFKEVKTGITTITSVMAKQEPELQVHLVKSSATGKCAVISKRTETSPDSRQTSAIQRQALAELKAAVRGLADKRGIKLKRDGLMYYFGIVLAPEVEFRVQTNPLAMVATEWNKYADPDDQKSTDDSSM